MIPRMPRRRPWWLRSRRDFALMLTISLGTGAMVSIAELLVLHLSR